MRPRTILLAALLALTAAAACEDDGGAPGWNQIDDGGAAPAVNADAGVRDAPRPDGAAPDAALGN
jgi:hypothetical protein